LLPALLSLVVGCLIGYVDSRPTWDDTGITAGSIFLASLLIAAWRPRSAWLTALLIGVPVFAFNVIAHGNLASSIAIVIALVGSAVGIVIAKAMGTDRARHASPPS
jgi:hypothetical protein